MEQQVTFTISREYMEQLGIEPERLMRYLEGKDIMDVKPIHVTAYFALKRELVSS